MITCSSLCFISFAQVGKKTRDLVEFIEELLVDIGTDERVLSLELPKAIAEFKSVKADLITISNKCYSWKGWEYEKLRKGADEALRSFTEKYKEVLGNKQPLLEIHDEWKTEQDKHKTAERNLRRKLKMLMVEGKTPEMLAQHIAYQIEQRGSDRFLTFASTPIGATSSAVGVEFMYKPGHTTFD
jgi:hypothetical protein